MAAPQPWSVRNDGETIKIVDANGAAIAAMMFVHLTGRRDFGEVVQSARLIAAAPEMYEALKAIAAETKWQNAPHEILHAARAALAKTEA